MIENDQDDNSRFRRRASILLWINGVALLAILWLIVGDILGVCYIPAVVGYFITVAFFWSIFGMPLSTTWVAEGAWNRLNERRAKMQFGCRFALLVIWVPLIVCIFLCLYIRY